MILYWPSLVLVAPLIVTFTAWRSAWTWLSLAAGLVVVWGLLMIASWEWANGRSGGILAPLMQPPTGGIDRSFHDTYYVAAHLKWLGGLAIPAAVIGAVQFTPAHPSRTRIDIALFWATITAFILTTAAPTWYFQTVGMPRRYIDYEDSFATANMLAAIGGLIYLGLAFVAFARPFWSWWRARGGPPHAL